MREDFDKHTHNSTTDGDLDAHYGWRQVYRRNGVATTIEPTESASGGVTNNNGRGADASSTGHESMSYFYSGATTGANEQNDDHTQADVNAEVWG